MRNTPLAVFAAVCLVACSGAPPGASAEAADSPRTLVVSGTGEASAEPDMATLFIGVETEAPTAAAALADNAAKMRAAIDRLKAGGVEERDIQTRNISVNPRYDYENNRRSPRITGYVASNTVVAKLRDLKKAGAIIDDAVADGANTLGGLSFGFAEPEPLLNEARRDAVRDARAKAQLYAEAAGVSLGPVLQIQDGAAAAPPTPYMDLRVAAAKAESTPISAGESTLTAQVTLIYEIR